MQQAALNFDPPPLERKPFVLAAAKRQGDAAIAAGADKATRVDPSFIDTACAHIVAYLKAHGCSSGELLTDSCKLAGIRPVEDRHFGVVFQRLIRRNQIRWAGECRRVKGHASRGGSLYEATS